MPRIREYNQQTGADGLLRTQASPEDFGAAIGRGISQAAEGFGQAYRSYREDQQRTNLADADAKLTPFQLQMLEKFKEAQTSAAPGAPQFKNNFAALYDAEAQKVLDSTGDERSRQYLRGKLDDFKVRMVGNALSWEAEQQTVFRVNQRVKTVDDSAKLVNSNPELYEVKSKEVQDGIDADDLTPDKKQKLKDGAKSVLSVAAVEGYVGRDTYQAATKLLPELVAEAYKRMAGNDAKVPLDAQGNPLPQIKIDKEGSLQPPQNVDIPGWKDLTLDQQQKIMGKLVLDWNSKVSADRDLLNDKRKDMLANFFNGNRYDGEKELQARYAQVYGPEKAARLVAEDRNAKAVGVFVQGVRGRSPEEALAVLGRGPGNNATADDYATYERKRAALEADFAERKRDPHAYVAQFSPAARQAQQALLAAQNEFQTRPAPDTQAAVRSALQNSITVNLAEQRRIGIPNPQVLSEAQEKELVGRLQSVSVSGQDASQQVQQLYADFGQYGPTVAAQLSGKVSGIVNVLGSGIDANTGALLVEANRNKADLKKTLEPEKTKDLDVAIQTRMRDYAVSLAGVPNSASILGTYQDQIGALAMLRMSKYGESQAEAVKKSFEALVGSQYSFVDGYRVPKSVDVSAVRDQARRTLRDLGPQDVMLLPGGAGSPQDRMDRQLQEIRDNAKWVTMTVPNANGVVEEGLVLAIPTPGGFQYVPDASGRPLFRSFGELGVRAATRTAPTSSTEAARDGDMRNYERLRARERAQQLERQNQSVRDAGRANRGAQ